MANSLCVPVLACRSAAPIFGEGGFPLCAMGPQWDNTGTSGRTLNKTPSGANYWISLSILVKAWLSVCLRSYLREGSLSYVWARGGSSEKQSPTHLHNISQNALLLLNFSNISKLLRISFVLFYLGQISSMYLMFEYTWYLSLQLCILDNCNSYSYIACTHRHSR